MRLEPLVRAALCRRLLLTAFARGTVTRQVMSGRSVRVSSMRQSSTSHGTNTAYRRQATHGSVRPMASHLPRRLVLAEHTRTEFHTVRLQESAPVFWRLLRLTNLLPRFVQSVPS